MARFVKLTLLVAATVLALNACVDLRPPGLVGGTRSDIGESLPRFIVEGRTTRDTVLLHLGEPDERGYFDRWFVYRSQHTLGGAAVGMVPGLVWGAEAIRYRRIEISFDDAGIVDMARFVARAHVQSFDSGSMSMWRMDSGSESVRDRFPDAVHRAGNRWIDGAIDVTNQALIFWFKPELGSGNPVLIRLRAESIADVRWGLDDNQQGGPTVLVARADGGSDVFAFRPLAGKDPAEAGAFDRARAERFIEGVKSLKAVSAITK